MVVHYFYFGANWHEGFDEQFFDARGPNEGAGNEWREQEIQKRCDRKDKEEESKVGHGRLFPKEEGILQKVAWRNEWKDKSMYAKNSEKVCKTNFPGGEKKREER